MAIYKTKNLIETYRIKAKSSDINELNGRTARPDLTKFIINNIASKLQFRSDDSIIDIGCGDGSLLLKLAENGVNGYSGRLIGILPTKEEVCKVRGHLLNTTNNLHHLISIELGFCDKTNLPDNYCDILVCNSVLHNGGQSLKNTQLALQEFYRVTKPGGKIFIGEIPCVDENANKTYGDSISSWLIYVLKKDGLKSFFLSVKKVFLGCFSSEPFIIQPKSLFFMPPIEFIELLNLNGFELIEHYKLMEIDNLGTISESKTRWNYIAIKK